MIKQHDYLDFAGREYLDDFIAAGGAAVKFAVHSEAAGAEQLEKELRALSMSAGYVYANVDSSVVKMSMIDRVFHAVAAQVPWRELALSVVTEGLNELRFPAPPDEPLTLQGIARFNDYDYQQLRKDFNRRLQEKIFRDYELSQAFRIAMILLCQAEVSAAPDTQATAEGVLQWLRGELRHISQLKPDLIYQKIARNNALHMLYSLGPWLRKAGRAGLVLHLDIRQCAVTTRRSTEGIFYTKPGVLDVYELLRQLIDATDELKSTLIMVSAGNEFLSDPNRGLERYWALRLRILDEVRDRSRTNPYSALVRLSDSTGAQTEARA